MLATALVALCVAWQVARSSGSRFKDGWQRLLRNQTDLPLRAAVLTVLALCAVFGPLLA